jgi:hypothetical protein
MKVTLISKGKGKAEVVIRQDGANGNKVSETRHLKWTGGHWTDRAGNVFLEGDEGWRMGKAQ